MYYLLQWCIISLIPQDRVNHGELFQRDLSLFNPLGKAKTFLRAILNEIPLMTQVETVLEKHTEKHMKIAYF